MTKRKTLELIWRAGVAGDKDHYLVKRTTNTVEWHPGQRLEADEVRQLITWSKSIEVKVSQ